MTQFPIGLIVLGVIAALIFFGLAQRVLDRLRLTDREALVIIVALIAGSFINIPLITGRWDVSINLGGALIPIILAGYLLFKAGTGKEAGRALLATLVTAGIIIGIGTFFRLGAPAEPGGRFLGMLDSLWMYPIIAGAAGYLLAGRSRRSAFIAATLGIVLADAGYFLWLVGAGAPAGTVAMGGAGVFDAVVLAGVFAVLLAEIVGEARERLQGGPSAEGRPGELMEGLRKPEPGAVDEAGGKPRDLEKGGGER
jgi:uncharacterized membrane protein